MTKVMSIVSLIAFALVGCSQTVSQPTSNLTDKGTLELCRDLASTFDPATRQRLINVLIKRRASPDHCGRLIAGDNAMATGIAIVAVGVAAGAAAANGGGYYGPSSDYGVAWDQFYDQYGRLTWRCRERGTGQFAFDHRCSGKPMTDSTWPGWSA